MYSFEYGRHFFQRNIYFNTNIVLTILNKITGKTHVSLVRKDGTDRVGKL